MTQKTLCTGDKVKLITTGYGDPTEDCVVIAHQQGNLVWFTAVEGGACHVARRQQLQLIKRGEP